MAKIPEVHLETWKSLYAEAQRFSQSKPWQRIDESLFFAVQGPATGQMGYACILGSLGEFLALSVYRGAEGFGAYQAMLLDEPALDEESAFKQDCLMAQFTDSKYVETADRKVIRALGLKFEGHNAWPLFRSYRPGYFPWHLDQQEAAFLTLALRCACDWVEKLSSSTLNSAEAPGQIFTYLPKAGGSPELSDYENAWTQPPAEVPQQPAVLDPARLARLQAKPLKKGGVWEAEVFYLPITIADQDRPYHARLVLLVDQDSGFILPGGVMPPGKTAAQLLADAVLGAVEEVGCLPEEIRLRDRSVLPALQAAGQALGVHVKIGRFRSLPQAKKSLVKRFASQGRGNY